MIWWGKGERNEVFIINFAKESLFKHGISFDVVGGDHWSPLYFYQIHFFYACHPVEQMYSYIDNKYYLCYILTIKVDFLQICFKLL